MPPGLHFNLPLPSVGKVGLSTLCLAILLGGPAYASGQSSACVPDESNAGVAKCTITTIEDCGKINDFPYARNVFCPAAFLAAEEMLATFTKRLHKKLVIERQFYFFQTVGDPEAQTTTACMETTLPGYGVLGAGKPLCELLAYVTSPGPTGSVPPELDNPAPFSLRDFPDLFSNLFWQGRGIRLKKFHQGSLFDPVIQGLGADGVGIFVAEYEAETGSPFVAEATLYEPTNAFTAAAAAGQYNGISGGGGGGWGAQVSTFGSLGSDDTLSTLLAFGGGGGGGMSSPANPPPFVAPSHLGGGGGAGMQLANGYSYRGKSYNGLGLGAGANSDDSLVQYSYSSAVRPNGDPGPVTHEYDHKVVREYHRQLKKLRKQLKYIFRNGGTVLLEGGGGMGAGAEYFDTAGSEYSPHALSTQAGFQFSYQIRKREFSLTSTQQVAMENHLESNGNLYAFLGAAYQEASKEAYEDCGKNYENYACICRKSHAIVICKAAEAFGADKIPAWLNVSYCPASVTADKRNPEDGLRDYQRRLLGALDGGGGMTAAASKGNAPADCANTVKSYFLRQNTPEAQK